ncbi:MAG TPA: FtsX-like permease family protein [Candidatus Cybelea sp.]|nr:FtsX-like permease family protein [Candidatus Cybelea sp.]
MMFGRLLMRLLCGSRGRLAVTLVALVSGATVISALVNVELDLDARLAQEFRSLGANIVISSKPGMASADAGPSSRPLLEQSQLESGLRSLDTHRVVASAPYLHLVGRVDQDAVVIAGTWLDQTARLEPTWKVEGGSPPSSRADLGQCLVGRNVARHFNLHPGSAVRVNYPERVRLSVAGVMETGSSEDNQIFVSLPLAQRLAARPNRIEVWELSVPGNAERVAAFVHDLASRFPDLDVQPIRQVTLAEGDLLGRVRGLIMGMALLILVLTALCVLATMAALAMERRQDVGLMKALGGSISRVVGLFLAEVGTMGAVGGIVGCLFGVALSAWMGRRVFGTSISARWETFPLTISLMIGVALAGALPLRLLGRVKPAVILRGD